jgi:hypothetical protein
VGATSNRTDPIYLDGKQIAETVVGAATQYFHADALGSPVERSLSTGAGSISFLPVAEGVSGGFFAHPNEGYEVKLGNGDSPLTFKGGGEVKGGFILVGGVEAEVDPRRDAHITPKAGVGGGEPAKYGPSIKIFEWEKKRDEKQMKTEEK